MGEAEQQSRPGTTDHTRLETSTLSLQVPQEILEIATTWLVLASRDDTSRDPLFRFIAAWVAFNAIYAALYTSDKHRGWKDRLNELRNRDKSGSRGKPGEKEKVQLFSTEPETAKYHRVLLVEDERYREAVSYLKSRPVYNTDNGRCVEIEDERVLEQVLLSVYRARCNLFHGAKVPHNLRDARVAKAGYTIVSILLRPLLT